MGYKRCFVAFIDILGFKKYVEENPCESIQSVLLTLKTEEFANPSMMKSKFGIEKHDINILCVSDSVIIAIEENVPHSLDAIIWLCASFQAALLLNKGLIMRGGVSCGDFYWEDGMLFGPAYQKAVYIEQSHNTPRIILDDAIGIENLTDYKFLTRGTGERENFVDYMAMVVVNYLRYYKLENIKRTIENSISKFKDDEKTLAKYVWLQEYYNLALKKSRGLSRFIITQEDEDNGQT